MIGNYRKLLFAAVSRHWLLLLGVCLGFPILYYLLVLAFTVLRFGQIPNYVEFYNMFHVYHEIWQGTPSLTDMVPIIMGEPWFETGFKDPLYYGIATWSYMLIPPKMVIVLLFGLLLGLFLTLLVYTRSQGCALQQRRLAAGAGFGSVMISLTNVTLTWVVCCATPSWVVALSMLGMSSSLSLLLEPLGTVMSTMGLAMMLLLIWQQLRTLARDTQQHSENL